MKRYIKYIFIVGLLANIYLAVRSIYNFANGIDKGDSFMGIMAYGIGIILFSGYLYSHIKNKKRTNSSRV